MNFGSLDRGWAAGDFDGDRVVQCSNFVLLVNDFGFQRPTPIAGIRRLLYTAHYVLDMIDQQQAEAALNHCDENMD